MTKQDFINRFISYAKIDTQADPNSETLPSSKKQLVLAKKLVEELKDLNINYEFDEQHGFIYARIDTNEETYSVPTIAYIAHMDTAPDFSSENVNPQIIDKYDGKDIKLDENTTLSPNVFSSLKTQIDHTLIHTDGTTLLGSDDKSGITIIMEMLKYYIDNPQVAHANVVACFSVDEEIGKGAHHIDLNKLNADFGYTIDGGGIGEYSYETFNAAQVEITFNGKSVHPGSAKNKLINSLQVANYFNQLLPVEQRPEYTENREGFYHLTNMSGDISQTKLSYIIRDHDSTKFEFKKQFIDDSFNLTVRKFNVDATINITDQYYNMAEKITNNKINELVLTSMNDLQITPNVIATRGGTDGSILTYRGLPTPNIFTGGYNFHGKFEYLSVDEMMMATKLLLKINENNLTL